MKELFWIGVMMERVVERKITDRSVSHDREEETIEAKARWFQSLSIDERIELLCQYTDMILAVNPNIVEQKNAQSIKGRVLVLSKA